jgi:glycosyltransferase involved in cell wall biosynthesis
MTVGVIIPAYNAECFIAKALESVLAQTRAPQEILVVDDGSIDNTAAVVSRYRGPVRYFRQENRGVGAARNKGVELTQTERIVFLDADDRLLPEALSRQCEVLKRHPEVDVLAYNFWHVAPSGERLADCLTEHVTGIRTITWSKEKNGGPWIVTGGLVEALVRDFPMAPAVSSIRRSTLKVCGGFNEAFRTAEDLDLFLRLAKLGQVFAFIPEPLSLVLQRPKSLCRGNPRAIADRLGVLTTFGETHSLSSSEASTLREAKAACEISLAWQEFESKAYARSRVHALRAMSLGRRGQGAKAWIHTLPVIRRLGHDPNTSDMPKNTGNR